jgi:hypothetical protein
MEHGKFRTRVRSRARELSDHAIAEGRLLRRRLDATVPTTPAYPNPPIMHKPWVVERKH